MPIGTEAYRAPDFTTCETCRAALVRTSEQYFGCPNGHGKLVGAARFSGERFSRARAEREEAHVRAIVDKYLPRYLRHNAPRQVGAPAAELPEPTPEAPRPRVAFSGRGRRKRPFLMDPAPKTAAQAVAAAQAEGRAVALVQPGSIAAAHGATVGAALVAVRPARRRKLTSDDLLAAFLARKERR